VVIHTAKVKVKNKRRWVSVAIYLENPVTRQGDSLVGRIATAVFPTREQLRRFGLIK
jgi:hypothetical protein